MAIVWSKLCMELDLTAGHEVIHALGMVDLDAPNYSGGGHVDDHEGDLMNAVNPGSDFIVDYGRDDYYNENGLPADIKNLAESPFLLP